MPEHSTIERARRDARAGKSASTQAGEFVREEFHHVREGKHGARSAKQAIAIGLSKARRAGVKLPPPARGQSPKVRRQAQRDYERGQHGNGHVSRRRSRATLGALKHEGRGAASTRAISRQNAPRHAETNSVGAFRRSVSGCSHERSRRTCCRRTQSGADKDVALKHFYFMIRKLKSGEYRLYSRKINPATGRHRSLGTFDSMAAAQRHERQVQFFKRQ